MKVSMSKNNTPNPEWTVAPGIYSNPPPNTLPPIKEKVDHPQHYNPGIYEAINVIEAYGLGFNLGNTLKYLLRAGVKSKETEIEDLEKAIWYLNREIEFIKRDRKPVWIQTK